MPSVKIKAAAGSLNINYTISTPSKTSAKSIDSKLPILLFLHPVYLSQEVFHPQFSDPLLRKFNLVTFDMRGHGETGGKVEGRFTRTEGADDVIKLMDALKLEQVHLIGLSMGACIALQTSILHPTRVSSCTMIAPLPLKEPESAAEGRREIYDCWVEAFHDPKAIDYDIMRDAVSGAMQLGFNSNLSPIAKALSDRGSPLAVKNWTPKTFNTMYELTVGFFVSREPHPRETLARIQCPVHIMHCEADIAYPIEYAQQLENNLRAADVDVHLSSIGRQAPHFGSITHPDLVNPLIHESVKRSVRGPLPPSPESVSSPFEETLVKCGLNDTDSDEDIRFL
ncbi:Alpha/Beta hydrolase protein [Schizophyllum amplum]|uniref:Alpha/Beta hydrolase protein n=1 Tax=Schizophyllum amplum TaxID=97359 RepID=A0A550CDQ7_9AGAR|nr:Alpha/Beta hydrolase protein [Auriculariopsis ampla]